MLQAMLDLETMGTGSNAAIISIGAVAFNPEGLITHAEFYQEINLQSTIDAGLEVDGNTVMWWLKQSEEARGAFAYNDGANPLSLVLSQFSAWCNEWEVEEVWGNGAAFDNAKLSNAYTKVGINQPWKHWNDRCYRTVKNMYPEVKIERVGVHHNALDDAKSQALHLISMGVL